MRTAATPARPTLAPLRAVSDVLDVVEVDLETLQRDLVLAERLGLVALLAGTVALVGGIAFVVVRRSRARHTAAPVVPGSAWPPVPVAAEAREAPGSTAP